MHISSVSGWSLRYWRLFCLTLLLGLGAAVPLPPDLVAQTLTRGPYLQLGTDTSIVVR